MEDNKLISQNSPIQEFRLSIEGWMKCYKKVAINYFAIKTPSDRVLYLCRIILNTGVYPSTAPELNYESKHIDCGMLELEFSKEWLDKFFENTYGSKLVVSDTEYKFILNSSKAPRFYHNKTSALGINVQQLIPGLDITGGELSEYVNLPDADTLNWEVRSGKDPYDDTAELLTLLNFRSDLFSVSSPKIEIVALPPGVIAPESSMRDGKASIKMRLSKKADKSKVSLAYKIVKNDGMERGTLDLSEVNWKSQSEIVEGDIQLSTGHSSLVHLFLQYNERAIHHWWISDSNKFINPLLATYECFDEGSEILKKLLFKPKDNSIGFELGVSLLLSIRGFTTSHLGIQEKLQKGPDLIAYVPGVDAALVIECTTDILTKNDKLAKLLERTQALRDALQSSGYRNTAVYPIIVSLLPRERLSADMQDANRNGVAVVAQEQLRKWFDQRIYGLNQHALFEEIVGLISPEIQQGFPFDPNEF